MNKMQSHRLVEDYLRNLEKAAAHLQRARRAELVAEIREHIEAALRQEDAASDAAVLNVLERLGPPEEIVEAAAPSPATPAPKTGWLEIAALVALLVPFMGWLLGLVLVVASSVWSRREKLVGAALLLLPVLVLGLGVTVGGPDSRDVSLTGGERPAGSGQTDSDQGAGSAEGPGSVELVLFGAGLPSALFLGWRLRRDRRPASATY